MTNLLFQFRLQSRHGAAGEALSVDVRNDELEPWQPLEPSLQTPASGSSCCRCCSASTTTWWPTPSSGTCPWRRWTGCSV
jgi:hypothetical protein